MQIIFYLSTNKKNEKSNLSDYFQSIIPFFSTSTLKSLKYICVLKLLWGFSLIFTSGGLFRTQAAVRDVYLIPPQFRGQVSQAWTKQRCVF